MVGPGAGHLLTDQRPDVVADHAGRLPAAGTGVRRQAGSNHHGLA